MARTVSDTTASPPTAPKAVNAKEDRHFVTALARGLDVLSAFRSRDRMLGNQELARRCGLPKSTISRLTYTLTKHGYLETVHDSSGAAGYRLGSAVLALGSAMLAGVCASCARTLVKSWQTIAGNFSLGMPTACQ